MLGLVGGVEQCLGAVGQGAGLGTQHDAADLATHGRVTGLERQPYGVPLGEQPVAQPPGLGGLARALAALEAHEDAAPGVHGAGRAGGGGHGRDATGQPRQP